MKTVGILGGMGSMATVDFFSKIIHHTKVTCDQDHLHVIVENSSHIPDRTAYILNKGQNPIKNMISAAKNLEQSGVDFITMPCNTAHYFYDAIQQAINIPILHIIQETAEHLKKCRVDSVILLATEGTYTSGLYKTILKKYNITIIYPNSFMRLEIDELIYTYKEKNIVNQPLKSKLLTTLSEINAGGIILGCTELPLIFSQSDCAKPVFDPTLILAKSAICYAGGKIKKKP